MAKPGSTEIIDMGFGYEMFGLSDLSALVLQIDALIEEHGSLLSGRIGAAAYASAEDPLSSYVKRALKCQVAADLCQRRINRLAQEAKLEDGGDAKKMRQNRLDYLNEAERMISKVEVLSSSSNDFASALVVNSHFGEDA